MALAWCTYIKSYIFYRQRRVICAYISRILALLEHHMLLAERLIIAVSLGRFGYFPEHT